MFNLVSYFKIKKILQAEKCEAVITNNLLGLGFLTPLAIRNLKIYPAACGVKHLHIAHDIQLLHPAGLMHCGQEARLDGFFAKIYSRLCRALFKSPEVIIFPSRWLKNFYLKKNFFSRSKIMVLPNPVDFVFSRVGERLAKFHPASYRVKFLFIGQVEKHKGVFLLLAAFNKIKEKYPAVELLVAGAGSQLAVARKQAQGNKNVKFLGWPGDERVDELLSLSHCLVYPSLVYENCPNAIERALAAGLPVLASNLGGIPELLSDGAGVLFKPADADDLAEKMAWLIENKDSLHNLVEIGRRRAEFFKVENYVKRLEELLILDS